MNDVRYPNDPSKPWAWKKTVSGILCYKLYRQGVPWHSAIHLVTTQIDSDTLSVTNSKVRDFISGMCVKCPRKYISFTLDLALNTEKVRLPDEFKGNLDHQVYELIYGQETL